MAGLRGRAYRASMATSVTLLGATGLVGREALRLLLGDPRIGRVVAVGRRALPPELLRDLPRERLDERVIEMDRVADHADLFASDALICALGTTMKQAGSREAFRRVDHDIPLDAARVARANGTAHYLLVSALGADAGSRVFYNRVKGEVERELLALSFHATTILRPSLLAGTREDVRAGEVVGRLLGLLVPGRLRPVRARDVARVLVERTASAEPGARVIESDEIRALARR